MPAPVSPLIPTHPLTHPFTHPIYLLPPSTHPSGADDFTPLLIYVVIKAATPALASNLAYIERYRYHPKLTAEAQYYYIQLVRTRGGGWWR